MGNQVPPPPKLSEEEERSACGFDCSVNGIVAKLRDLEERRSPGVLIMAGAGISVSAGIPDFRTPGTGLYDNLQKYNLPEPQSIFDIGYFSDNPKPFCMLAKEMYPGNFKPTPTHHFIKLLEDKGLLLRCFTQNIDTLEREAGISEDKLVEAHGSFASAHCIACGEEHSKEWVKEVVFADQIPRCLKCQELVKPDIVFFGENLPRRFARCRKEDLPEAEVLIVLGTSLSVQPFAGLVNDVPHTTPRLLINRERVGERDETGHGFRFNTHDNYRDSALLTSCDAGVRAICDALNWRDDLEARITAADGSTDGAAAATATPVDEGAERESMASLFAHNWRKPKPPLPPLQPISGLATPAAPTAAAAAGGGGGGDAAEPAAAAPAAAEAIDGAGGTSTAEQAWTLTLVEPAPSELAGGRAAYFRLEGLPEDLTQGNQNSELGRSREQHFLCLMPQGSDVASQRTDRDFPFPDTSELEEGAHVGSPDRLRLRLPFVRGGLTFPYDFQVWYVNQQADEVVARWGPLTVERNAEEDAQADEQESRRNMQAMSEDELDTLAEKMAAGLGFPKAACLSMLRSQLGGADEESGSPGDEEGAASGEHAAGGGPEIVELEDGAVDPPAAPDTEEAP